MNVRPGDRLGDWVVVNQLGAGGMGSVYRCHSTLSPDVRAAVKVLAPHDLGNVEDRFVREMRTLAALAHPSIVKVLGGGRDERRGLLYMAMELVEGDTLERLLARGPMTTEGALRIFAQLADALSYAHANGVAHRDIKPANIMIRRDATPVIVDFGIAVADEFTRFTNEATVPGTLPYLPPEVFRGQAPDPRAGDAYALGVVMWESVTGEVAFSTPPNTGEHERMVLVMGQKLRADALDPGASLAPPLRDAILRTTDPEPETRLIDLAEVRSLLAGEGTLAGPLPRRSAVRRRAARSKWLVATAGLLGAVTIVGLLVALLATGSTAWWLHARSAARAVATPPVDLASTLREGSHALEQGELGPAWRHAGTALDDHPEDPYANLLYGQVLAVRGDGRLARPYLCAAVDGGLAEQVQAELSCERGGGGAVALTGPLATASVDLAAALGEVASGAGEGRPEAKVAESRRPDGPRSEFPTGGGSPGAPSGAKSAPTGNVKLGPPVVSGGASAAEVERALRRVSAQLRACYAQGLASDPRLQGKLSVALTLAPSGTVDRAKVTSSTLGAPEVESCVVRSLQGLRLPAGADDAGALVVVPLTFAPG